jgi:Ca2+-binding RTX toxin-like protein
MARPNRVAAVISVSLLGTLLLGPEVAQAAPRCFGKAATIVGTNARNRIRGTAGRDVIVGLGGNDVIVGLAGNDLLCGNGGHDLLAGDRGGDRLSGESGADVTYGGDGRDLLRGGVGVDGLLGNNGNDRLFGQGSQDQLFGQPGDDLLHGGRSPFDVASYRFARGVVANLGTERATGDGTDRFRSIEILEGSRGEDMFTGDAGRNYFWDFLDDDVYDGRGGLDLVSFFRARNPIDANLANDAATGQGSDVLTSIEDVAGSDQRDDLTGEGESNLLGGFRGNDTLIADAGEDFLFGDAGTDTGDGGPDQDRCRSIEIESNCELSRSVVSALARAAGKAVLRAPTGELAVERPAFG